MAKLKIYIKIMLTVYFLFSIPVAIQNILVYIPETPFKPEFIIIPFIVSTIIGFLLSKNKILKIKLEKSNLAKSEFLSRVSHEFRTPLNSILGFSHLLLTNLQDITDTQKNYISRIHDSGKHLLKIVNELLEISAIKSQNLQLNFTAVDIIKCLEDSIELLSPLAIKQNITIDNQTCDCSPVMVFADPSRLLEIFLNIGSNGIKYNQPNGSISLNCNTNKHGEIIISFKDTGPGIPEDRIQEIFDPFSRINAESNIEGSGLGLAITKNLVELMNGKIGCNNNASNKGCEFWVSFKEI